MITARPQKNLTTAKAYFAEHLAQGDYYAEGQKVDGVWFGKGVERLGLDAASSVTEEAFTRLCENRHPLTGDRLTVRQKADRRAFYDFVVSPPKSISIMALTVGDPRIAAAHDRACRRAMLTLEEIASAYVRKGGKSGIRQTGEVVAAIFRHDCSRALDPQLHTHFVEFNATWDAEESRWKALETSAMFDRVRFATEVYRSALAAELVAIGYFLRRTEQAFEIEGVSPEIIQRFSKRKAAISEAEARLMAKLGRPVSNNARAALAHSTRQRKVKNLSVDELRRVQRAQLSDAELQTLQGLVPREGAKPAKAPGMAAAEAVEYARAHLFERKSVVTRHEFLQTALSCSYGTATLDEVQEALAARTDFVAIEDELTTREALRQERRLVAIVNEGIEACRPLNPRFVGSRELDDEQRTALTEVLQSRDRVVGLRGGAGTGKSFLLKEIFRGLEERYELLALAPTSSAVDVLHKDGLRNAMTVQRFLVDPEMRNSVRGRVLVVDEAGRVSTNQLVEFLEFAREASCRVVLCGDTRQHTSIEAGDGLRILERFSALRTAELKSIRRQVDAEYRKAVGEIAAGRPMEGLARLDRLGAVEEVPLGEREERMAADYAGSLDEGKSALIVCPTWREIEAVTRVVREKLQETGRLSRKEKFVTVHRSLHWTAAQKRDLRLYETGQILVFHRTTQKMKAGEWCEVVSAADGAIQARRQAGGRVTVTKKQAACFDVAEKRELAIAPGDQLLLQGNRKTEKLLNGQVVMVKKMGPSGRIHLMDGRKIKLDFKSFTHGYAVTSHASQARTVDHVYVSVGSTQSLVVNRNQFYVSISRGRERVKIYTDDKQFLYGAVERPGTRLSAMELFERQRRCEAVIERATPRHSSRTRIAI